jgi:hypothetical protein
VLAEKAKPNTQNQLELWTFAIPNSKTDSSLSKFLVPTVDIERRAGLQLWDRLWRKE